MRMVVMLSRCTREVVADSSIEPLVALASSMRERGRPFVSMMNGDVSRPTVPEAKLEAIAAIEADFTKYTAPGGMPELNDGVSRRLERLHGVRWARDEILITPGAALGAYYALLAIGGGRTCLTPAPCWWSYQHQATLAGGSCRLLETTARAGHKLSRDTLERALAAGGGPLILNNPTNPTGALYGRAELEQLAAALVAHHTWCIVDETYDSLVYEGEFVSMAALPHMKARTLVVGSFSKAYAMTGWRVGYLCGPRDVVAAAERMQASLALAPSSISQRAALGALRTSDETLQEHLAWHRDNRQRAVHVLRELPLLDCERPPAGIFLFPDVSGLYGLRDGRDITGSLDLCKYLLEEHHVLVAPGSAFGSDRHIRICFSLPQEVLSLGLMRLCEGITRLAIGQSRAWASSGAGVTHAS